MVVFKTPDIRPFVMYCVNGKPRSSLLMSDSRDIRPFVMYCVNGKPRSSLLIESTDSMIIRLKKTFLKMNKEIGMLLLKKELIQVSGVGKINNYNNTH